MSKRQLSAIMFTDLSGYTAMMQQDETRAKTIRDNHRAILEREINTHNGQILQYYGDGALSIFNSTISAADSAISIQKASVTQNIPLKIGIHAGDVVIEEHGVYGDGVNIASRIESFSVSGSVMISDKVYDDIKNHLQFEPRLMGEFELKNVRKPIEVYALTNEGLKIPDRTELQGKVKERIKSIVVLPMVNSSPDPAHEYFCDGLTEELIAALTQLPGLQVLSRSSSFSLKGSAVDIRQLGSQLKVQAVLEGSIRRSGERIRMVAQLSSTADGYELWTQRYDRIIEDELDLQDELQQLIMTDIVDRGLVANTENGASEKPVKPEAYDLYLKGLYYYNQWTPITAEKAVGAFTEATTLVPEYDEAHAGIALAYTLMATTGYLPPQEGSRRSVQAANQAIAINPNNENAYCALCFNDFFFDWNFDAGKLHSRQALEINPKSAQANVSRSLYSLVIGDIDKALHFLQIARDIDPLSTLINRTLADAYYFNGDYKIAIDIYEGLLDNDPDFKAAIEFKAWSYLMMGEYDTAIDLFESINGDSVHAIKPFVQLGYAFALKGELDLALSYLEDLKKEALDSPNVMHDFNFATLYTGLGDHDKAFEYLNKCIDAKIGPLIFIDTSPIWRPLKGDPRFDKLKERIGLS